MNSDHYFLQRCLALGKQAAQKGNSPVGAVVVKDNELISEAEEAVNSRKDITCHAEVEAIKLAVKNHDLNDLAGCTLYSTHEPCVMCSYVIRFYKIEKVVYLQESEYLGGVSSPMALLVTNEVPPHWSNPPVIVHFKTMTESGIEK